MTTYTPGPWLVDIDRPGCSSIWQYKDDLPEEMICSYITEPANATLIAASTELLKACEALLWKVNRKEVSSDGSMQWAKIDIRDVAVRDLADAVNKAKGEPS